MPARSRTRRDSALTTRSQFLRDALSARHLLTPRQVIRSTESRLEYRIEGILGEGGFGQVFLARRRGRSTEIPEVVCVKASPFLGGWVREVYFGQLLRTQKRAMRVFDAFPLLEPGDSAGRVLYCLVLEYAPHGDLSSYLARTGKAWSEAGARREIGAVLEVLRKLHHGQTLHRDLTPMNVFVFEKKRLKLGDFGIARHQSNARGITARTMNKLTAPVEILAGSVPKWQARDDVYQVGQLLGMLVKGDARERLRTSEIRTLPCSDHLKEIIHRCLGERRKRYESAEELTEALRNPPARLRAGALRSLAGVHITFTGILSKPRKVAAEAARRAGAVVHGGPSAKTTVVVRGKPNPRQAAGKDAGLKLMEIKRLREKGHTIKLLSDQQFWRLVDEGRVGKGRTEKGQAETQPTRKERPKKKARKKKVVKKQSKKKRARKKRASKKR